MVELVVQTSDCRKVPKEWIEANASAGSLVMSGEKSVCRYNMQMGGAKVEEEGKEDVEGTTFNELCKMICPLLVAKEASSRACQGNLAPMSLLRILLRAWRVLLTAAGSLEC